MQGSLGTFDLDVEILDTIEGDSLAEASEGFDGHDRSLGVGTGVGRVGRWVSDQHQGQHVGTPPPHQSVVPEPWAAPPKGPVVSAPWLATQPSTLDPSTPSFRPSGHLGGLEASSQLPFLQ